MSGEVEQEAWIETWAKRIDMLGLSLIALPLLQVARTFGFLGSQALLFVQPLASGFVDDRTLERAIALLDNPELLEQLQSCLEGERS